MKDEQPTDPFATDTHPTDPAPSGWFDQLIGGKVSLADMGWLSNAGTIDNLKHDGVPGTVSVLHSYAGQTRANHYHREDSHLLYVVSGEVWYYERAVGEMGKPAALIFRTGEQFFTPPMREHAMYFPQPTVMVSMSDRSRTHEEHERDVVRVKVI